MELKGSRTEANLLAAFAGESQARNKYTYYASTAKKEGYEQISALFAETADNEKEHAKLFFKKLGLLGDTAANLAAAAAGEHYEWSEMYKQFAKEARAEGFEDIAVLFTEVGEVEEFHEKRYLTLLANVQKGQTFQRDGVKKWHCRNCGYVHEGSEAPDKCPACSHPQAYFELLAENY